MASQACKKTTELTTGGAFECHWLRATSESVMDGLLECYGGETGVPLCCGC